MAGLAACCDGSPPNLFVGAELLEMPVAGALLCRKVEAPIDPLFHDEVASQGAVVVNLQHKTSAWWQWLAGLRDIDGFSEGIDQLSAGAAPVVAVHHHLVEVGWKPDAIGLSLNLRSQREQSQQGDRDREWRNPEHGDHESLCGSRGTRAFRRKG